MRHSAPNLFVIDATFLIKASHQAFLGAPLLEVDGEDHTFAYGICRDLLRLRRVLGAARLVVTFGTETYAASDDPRKVDGAATLLKELGLPIVNAPKCAIIDASMAFVDSASHIVSANVSLLQLTEHGLAIILVDARQGNTVYDASTVRAKFGVAPVLIPDFLALTEAPRESRLTNSQAVRLLERFGGLKELLEGIDTLKHRSAVGKLKGNQAQLLLYRTRLLPGGPKPEVQGIGSTECNLDTQQNGELLRARRFHSLVRLLPTPEPVHVGPVAVEQQRSTYQPVVDAPALQRLVAAMRLATACAIDTEATDKDPHRAELLGVSFCFKKGEAFYVPLTPEDLRGLDSAQVLQALRAIAQCGAVFVGHNVKYDYVLLRRHGVDLSKIGFDTMLAAHECFHDWEFFNLKHLAQVLLGKTIKKYGEVVKGHKSLLDVPFQRLVQYACEDADTAFRLFEVLRNELQTRGLLAQFESETMTLALQLGRWEFEGIPVDEHRLQALRTDARRRVDTARDAIHNHLGKGVNLDSDQEIQAALLEDGDIAEFLRGKRPTTALLETLAGTSEAARRLVQYRRERDVLRRVEEVLERSQDGKLHPVFSQISSRYGQVTARQSNLFATNVLRAAVNESVWHLYPDTKRSLKALVTLSRDEALSTDLVDGYPAEFTPLGGTVGDFLLSVVVGTSNSKLSRKFLLEQSVVADLRHRMRIRYRHVFQWVDAVRRDAVNYGFVQNDGRHYHVTGLASSNLYKRQQAMNLCVRWLLQS